MAQPTICPDAGTQPRPDRSTPGLSMSKQASFAAASLAAVAACAAPMSQMGTVSTADVAVEQAKQLELALQTDLQMQQRLDDVSYPLLRSAAQFCGAAARPRLGMRTANAPLYKANWEGAARTLGYTDTLQVFAVAPGSPADRVGIMNRDRVLRVGMQLIPVGGNASAVAGSLLDAAVQSRRPIAITVGRPGGGEVSVSVEPESVCGYDVVIERSGVLNAFSDGQRIIVTTAMLRFVTDDDELAMVLSHEIAHNAMRHLDAQRKNATLGALFGAVVDLAAAAKGIDTQAGFTKAGAQAGSQAFSQDFEREADYVGLYVLAAAGRSIEKAPNLWRRLAVENPGSIQFASTHPTSAERFVRLEQWRREIATKLAAGAPLAPETRRGRGTGAVAVGAAPPARRPSPGPPAAAAIPATADIASAPAVRAGAASEAAGSLARLTPGPTAAAAAEAARAAATFIATESDERVARATIGAPRSDSARQAAVGVFAEGARFEARHDWARAEERFRQALRLDGSVAKYHAALGDVMLVQEKLEDAEASYTAALLIDVDNAEYRRQLKEVRRRRGR